MDNDIQEFGFSTYARDADRAELIGRLLFCQGHTPGECLRDISQTREMLGFLELRYAELVKREQPDDRRAEPVRRIIRDAAPEAAAEPAARRKRGRPRAMTAPAAPAETSPPLFPEEEAEAA